jgi:hypothetical protein
MRGETKVSVSELDFALDTEQWPRWPYLPLVERDGGKVGVMVAVEGWQTRVYLINLSNVHDLPGKTFDEAFKDVIYHEYSSIESLLGDWRID